MLSTGNHFNFQHNRLITLHCVLQPSGLCIGHKIQHSIKKFEHLWLSIKISARSTKSQGLRLKRNQFIDTRLCLCCKVFGKRLPESVTAQSYEIAVRCLNLEKLVLMCSPIKHFHFFLSTTDGRIKMCLI